MTYNPLSWRNCPSCKTNLVDDEILESLKHTCEPGAFHSKLLGGRNKETWKMEYWKCPECKTVFSVDER
jgi:phage FluMu protein Com